MQQDDNKTTSLKVQSAWLMFAKLVGFVFSFALPLLVVRFLSKTDVGTYRQAFQLITNAAAILPLGFSMSAYYYLSREKERRASAVLHILIFNLAVGLLAFAILALVPQTAVALFNNEALAPLAPLIGAVVCVWIFSTFIEMVAVANQEAKTATLFIIIAQLTKAILMVTAVLIFSTVEAFLVAALIQGILQTCFLIVYLHSRFPRFWTKFDGGFFIEQMRYALPLGLAGLLWILQTDIHFYFVGAQFSAAEFAVYAYGCFQLPLVEMLAESVNSVMIPRMSKLQSEGNKEEIKRLSFLSVQKLSLFYFPLTAFLAVMAPTFIVTLFTKNYEAAIPIFLINLILIPLQSVSVDAITRAFDGLGRFLVVIRIIACGVLFFVLFEEGRSYGLVGIIASVVIIMVIEKIVLIAVLVRKLKIGVADLPMLSGTFRTAGASIFAGATTFAVDRLLTAPVAEYVTLAARDTLGIAKTSLLDFISGVAVLSVCGAVFTAVFIACVFVLGILDEDEKQGLRSVLRKLRIIGKTAGETSEGTV